MFARAHEQDIYPIFDALRQNRPKKRAFMERVYLLRQVSINRLAPKSPFLQRGSVAINVASNI
jgi:hypothetical protein